MKLSKKNILFLSLSLSLLFLIPGFVFAQNDAVSKLPSLLPECSETGACRVCDIVNIFITLGRWLITGAAGLALLIIVYAGTMMVISAGNSEKISAAKKQIVGSVIGLGLVLVAFQLVAFIIFAVTTPSDSQNPATSQAEDNGSLKSFLGGIAWWSICDKEELIAANGKSVPLPSTANCIYWGDNTWCGKDGDKKCCSGVCTDSSKLDKENNLCPNAAAKIFQKNYPVQVAQNELALRAYLEKGPIEFWRDRPCTENDGPDWECTNLVGLNQSTLDTIIAIKKRCNCLVKITGGTEPGHKSHGPGQQTFDLELDGSNFTALTNALKYFSINEARPNFSRGYTCEANGGLSTCSPTSDGWLHVNLN